MLLDNQGREAMMKALSIFVFFIIAIAQSVQGHRPHDSVSALAVSPDGFTQFALIRGVVLGTTDHGASWSWKGQGLSGFDRHFGMYMSPTYHSDHTVFFHCDAGLYRSTNAGGSWHLLPGSPIGQVAFVTMAFSNTFNNDRKFWVAGTINGVASLWYSTDDGTSFQSANFPGVPTTMLFTPAALMVATDDGKLFGSDNGGATWQLVKEGLGYNIGSMAVTESGSPLFTPDGFRGTKIHLLLAGSSDILHASINHRDGDTLEWAGEHSLFSEVSNLENQYDQINVVGSHVSNNGELLYILPPDSEHILRSTDGGATWNHVGVEQGIRSDEMAQTSAYQSAQHKFFVGIKGQVRAVLGGFSGVHVTVDKGRTWGHLDTQNSIFTSIDAACSNAECSEWMVSACTYAAGCHRMQVFKSTLEDPNAVKSDAVFRTAENYQAKPSADYTVNAFSPNYAEDRIEFRANQANLYRSNNGFLSKKATLPPRLDDTKRGTIHTVNFSPAFGSDQTMFISGSNYGILKSNDGGDSWTQQLWTEEGATYLRLSERYDTDLTMATLQMVDDAGLQGFVHWSMDGGDYWNLVGDGSTPKSWRDLAVFRGTDNDFPVLVGLMMDDPSEVSMPYISDSGKDWKLLQQSPVAQWRPTGFAEHTLVLLPSQHESSSRHFFAGFASGGGRVGSVEQGVDTLLEETQSVPSIDSDSADMWTLDPISSLTNRIRGIGRMVVASPNYTSDGIMFGVGYYSLYTSQDGGVNWDEIMTLPHTENQRACGNDCSFCKATNTNFCLVCRNGKQRVLSPEGAWTCVPFRVVQPAAN